MLHRRIEELIDLGKRHDLVKLAFDLMALHAQDRAVHVDIFAARQLGMKPRADFQQRDSPPLEPRLAFTGFGDAAQEFEQRGFARAVAPDQTHHFAALHVEADVLAGPECVGVFLRRVESPPPAIDRRLCQIHYRLAERRVAVHGLAKEVGLAKTIDGDNGCGHKGADSRRGPVQAMSAKLRSVLRNTKSPSTMNSRPPTTELMR